jgi:hypothetical protein
VETYFIVDPDAERSWCIFNSPRYNAGLRPICDGIIGRGGLIVDCESV